MLILMVANFLVFELANVTGKANHATTTKYKDIL